MDAPASLSDFGQVKRRIIDPAVKELTEKDGWLIQWEPVKAGRKVKAVRFTFMRNPQGSLFNEQNGKREPKPARDQQLAPTAGSPDLRHPGWAVPPE